MKHVGKFWTWGSIFIEILIIPENWKKKTDINTHLHTY